MVPLVSTFRDVDVASNICQRVDMSKCRRVKEEDEEEDEKSVDGRRMSNAGVTL